MFNAIARKGCGRIGGLWNSFPRIFPNGLFWYNRGRDRCRECLDKWGNHVLFGERLRFLRKLTKRFHLYLFTRAWWSVFCIVIPKRTRCLYGKSINMNAIMLRQGMRTGFTGGCSGLGFGLPSACSYWPSNPRLRATTGSTT